MNIFSDFLVRVRMSLQCLIEQGDLSADLDISGIGVEVPRDPSHGDIATNAAIILARSSGIKPRVLGEKLAALLATNDDVVRADVAGPGFVNLHLKVTYWHQSLAFILESGVSFARLDIGKGLSVNVEYVSANPTGPLHVGHCRGAVFGDALANLLECAGYEVVREYYVNDAGAQLDKLTRSVFLRYRQALGESVVDFPDDLYPGDYLISFGEELASQFGDSLCDESKHFSFVRSFIISEMMKTIRSDLSALGIDHDVFFFESTLHSGVPSDIELIVEELKKKSLIYKGILPPPKGGPQEDWEDREQTLFCASAFGDDMDRPLVKSDGNYTYFTADIAYFRNKLNRGFQKMIYVLGADHDGYVKRLEAIAGAVAEGKAEVFVRLCRLVRLYRGGEKVKMSKRAGHFVTLNEVVSEVGPDAVRFMMLFRSHDAPLDFDFAKVVEQSHENPVFYVQYAHARACSVLRKAGDILPVSCFSASAISGENFSILVDESEVSLIRKLSAFRSVLERAVLSHEPHRIAFYLYELAGEFHALWNKGKEFPQLRFVDPDDSNATRARIALVQAFALVLSQGLSILGVRAVREMC